MWLIVCLPDGEKSLRICLLVSIEYTNVTETQTDKQTDRQTDGRTPLDIIGRAYAYSIARL